MIQALVQVSTSSSSSDAVQEILELLKQLRTNIEKDLEEATVQEENRKASWKSEKALLTTQKNNAQQRKGVLETNIDNYRVIIEQNEANAEVHDGEQLRFQELNENWQADCDQRNAAYELETTRR